MKTYLAAATAVMMAIITFVPAALAYPAPTKDAIKKLIVDEFYPASKPTDICKTTLDFKEILVAPAKALSPGEAVWAGVPQGTVATKILATFRVVQRTQMDAQARPYYTIKELTQAYLYRIDEFNKPTLGMVSNPNNREKTLQYNDETPPGPYPEAPAQAPSAK